MRTLFALVILAVLAAVFQTRISAIQQETPALKVLRFNWHERFLVDRKLKEDQDAALNNQLEQEMRNRDREVAAAKPPSQPDTTRTQRGDERLDILKRQQEAREIHDEPPAANKPYEYKLRVRNTGSQTVAAVHWVYVFTDPVTHKELLKHSFESKAEIRPGKEKELTIYSNSSPPKLINAKAASDKKARPWDEAVVIESIQFSDGTARPRK